MIIGTGTDIIEIIRIEKILGKSNFLRKFFTTKEIEYLSNKKPESIAGYFCAKEAVAKSLGTGFSGFQFTDIEIFKFNGAPCVKLHNKAWDLATQKGIVSIQISISHCKEYATAIAIAQTEAKGSRLDHKLNKNEYPLSILKSRNKEGHKGDYGTICIIGGNYNMSGAVILCAKAAFRAGVGLAMCVLPPSILDRVGSSVIEATYFTGAEKDGFLTLTEVDMDYIISKAKVIALGVGMGKSVDGESIISYLIENSNKPLIIDADGITMLAQIKERLNSAKSKIVITPHVSEMARLTLETTEYINSNKEKVAVEFASQYNCIVVLKGHNTVVTDGNRVYINNTGNPGMASGGSGDVLTGIIGALIAQGYVSYDAAVLGTYIHGYGGDIAFEKYGNGLIASDILDNIGECLK